MKNFMWFMWGCLKFLLMGVIAFVYACACLLSDKWTWLSIKNFIIKSYKELIEIGKE